MKSGGKNKGSSFERLICKKLSMWVSENKRDDIFCRSAGSGAMYTARFNRGKNSAGQSGDISSTDIEGISFINKVHVECKHYKTFGFEFLIFDKSSKISEWWIQAKRDAERSLRPFILLIIKRNNIPEIVIFNYEFKAIIDDYCGINDINIIAFLINKEKVFVLSLEEFIRLNYNAIKLGIFEGV